MKLYYDPISTASRPVVMFAADHDLDLELETVELATGQHLGELYRRINPNGLVPYLVDEGFAMGEASAILKYLAETTDSPTYPRDIRARARVNEAMDWFNTHFHRDFCTFVVYMRVLAPDHLPEPAALDGLLRYGNAHAPRWLEVLDRHMIGERRFVCGDEVTLADYLGSAYVTLGELVDYDFSPYPNIGRWLAAMKARPCWAVANTGFEGWRAAIRMRAA
jgi:glutathione S-transferase